MIGCLIIVGIVVALFIVGLIAGGGSKSGGPAAANDAVPAVEPLKVTAAEVASAYEANEARAQQAYDGRPLLVTATIAGVSLDFANDPFLQLKTSGFIPANAKLDDASKPKASGLEKGAEVTLLCQSVSEVVSIPQFADCAIQ